MARDIIHEYRGIYFDSQEEIWFAMWLTELMESGFVESWQRPPSIQLTSGLSILYKKTTQLKTKIKVEEKGLRLLTPSVYTPDFKVVFTNAGFKLFCSHIDPDPKILNTKALFFGYGNMGTCISEQIPFWFEVKPDYDSNNMTRGFVNNQKFLWDKHQVFVNLVHPTKLFEKTFMPAEARTDFIYKVNTKKKRKGEWKVNYTPKTLKEFLNESENGK